MAQRKSVQISDFRSGWLEELGPKVRHLLLEPHAIKKNLKSDQCKKKIPGNEQSSAKSSLVIDDLKA